MSSDEPQESATKQMIKLWGRKARDNTIGTVSQAFVYPFGKVRAALYVGAKQGSLDFGGVPRRFGGFYAGVGFMSLMRCFFSNCIPYVAVQSASPDASKLELRLRLVLGTIAGVFCFNLADAQRQMTLRAENRGLLSLLRPSELSKRTRGYAAGLTRTVVYNRMLTGDFSSYAYPKLFGALAIMTFCTGPLDYAAALKREFYNESYLRIITTRMKIAPRILARRYGVEPEIFQGLKTLGLMSLVRMSTLTFEIFAFKVAVREFNKYRNRKPEVH